MLLIFVPLLMIVCSFNVQATHVKAGEITVRNIGGSSVYEVTLFLYLDKNKVDESPAGELGLREDFANLDFGDGTSMRVPLTERIVVGENTYKQVYTTTHIYQRGPDYTISFLLANRNAYIVNINGKESSAGSDGITFYVETTISTDLFLGPITTPILNLPPIDNASPGEIFTYNPGAQPGTTGDSLSFKMVIPQQRNKQSVPFYQDPNDPVYNGKNVNGGPSEFKLNPVTGELTWDTPSDFMPYNLDFAHYNVAIEVIQWKKRANGTFFRWSATTRDMQITVKKRENKRPELQIPPDTCIVLTPGYQYADSVFVSDPDTNPKQNINLLWSSELSGKAALTHWRTGISDDTLRMGNPDTAIFSWTPTCDDIRTLPYLVHFKAYDFVTEDRRLSTYKTLQMKVYGDRPQNFKAEYAGKGFNLSWDPYYCTNADSILIYRKDCSDGGAPSVPCDPLAFIKEGYVKIGSAGILNNSYLDTNNIRPGATYCYISYATFPQFSGTSRIIKGLSFPTEEICVGAYQESILLTKASVEKTDSLNGIIELKWKNFISDTSTAYFEYRIFRSFGINGTDFEQVFSTNNLSDSIFIDSLPVLNTSDSAFTYRMELYKNGNLLTKSDTASTVFLLAEAGNESVDLNWVYDVPWLNEEFYHYIYKKKNSETEYILTDSIQGSPEAVSFTDNLVTNSDTFCYYVETRALYCLDTITSVIINKSQVQCVIPLDSVPPCPPVLFLVDENCSIPKDQFVPKPYKNFISWVIDTTLECNKGLAGFNLYFAPNEKAEFTLLQQFPANVTEFIHYDSTSQAGCYVVTAFNVQNLESDFSNKECNDNCFNFELPNLVTPGSDDNYNNYFRPFDFPKGVEKVELFVYNRWGGLVHHEITPANFSWDPSKPSIIADGIYYYHAKLTLERRLNPKDEIKNLKGWVQIIGNKKPAVN